MYVLSAVARLSRPLHILLAALTYVLGAGIARYLGIPTRLPVLLLGLIGAVLSQASMGLLAAVFQPAARDFVEDESPEQRRIVRNAALYSSIAALCAIAVAAFVIHGSDGLSTSTLFCMVLSLAVTLLFAVPPARFTDRGFGELLLATQIAYLIPSIGFLLQAGSYHRLLNACVIPLTVLLLATLVALEFPSYATDLKRERTTLLTTIGWANALRTHHALLISAYLLLALPAFSGFAFELFLPAFLSIPFAILQLLLLRGLAQGAKPIWNLLTANAVAVFGLSAYFLALSFWLR